MHGTTNPKFTHFIFSALSPENHAVYEKMWKNIVKPGRPQMTVWRLLIAWWMPNAANTLSECVILNCFST
jgi:hypothetical protein